MNAKSALDRKGITLIELLVGLIICGIVVAAIYRLFIAQTKAYTVQDQVVEIQQNVRSAMEILLRDLRMAGCDEDTDPYKSPIIPIVSPASNSITVNYKYYDKTAVLNQVQLTFNLNGSNLQRQQTLNGVASAAEVILPNVNSLIFTYGVDANGDGVVDDQNGNGVVDLGDYIQAGSVGAAKIISIRVQLSGNPSPDNPDVQKVVSPRALDSIVTIRNLL